MKIVICDDDRLYISTIISYLEKLEESDYEVYESGEDFLEQFETRGCFFDGIFLDMEMGGASGITIANKIREVDYNVPIVFATNHSKYMKESFVCEPVRFLEKPISFNDFKIAFNAVIDKLGRVKKTVIFGIGQDRLQLYYDDILYFECISPDIYAHTVDGDVHKIHISIKTLVSTIDNDLFISTHKSFYVNPKYIHMISDAGVTLINSNDVVPISRRRRENLRKEFLKYSERKYHI